MVARTRPSDPNLLRDVHKSAGAKRRRQVVAEPTGEEPELIGGGDDSRALLARIAPTSW
jgi:hypothetical protein